MWGAPSGNFMVHPFGNFASVPFGNFNAVASFNFMAVPPANIFPPIFPVPCGNFFPVPAWIPYAVAPGNFVPFPPVPPCNFNAGHSRNYKVDHPRNLNAITARKIDVNAVPHRPVNADAPRNVNVAFHRSSRPSVSEFSKNPKQYPGFVLVMVISTGRMEVMTRREASEKGKQVKVVSTPSEYRSGNTSFFRL